MRSIWIINQYIGTPALGVDGHRHYYFAQKFKEKGYNVSLLTSSFSHVPQKNYCSKNTFDVLEENYGTLGVIQTPKYSSARGKGRIWSMLVFMLKLFFFPFDKLSKPDVVIVSSISLLPILNGLFIRRKYGCKLVLEIRDIWPLSIIELGGYRRYNPFVQFLSFVEKLGYKRYDYITSLLPRTIDHIEEILDKRLRNFSHIPNGIYLNEKKINTPLNKVTMGMIPKNKFIVGYAGSLGVANAMKCVIEAINQVDDDDVYLCIVGSGYMKDELMRIAKNPNILFLEPIPKVEVEDLLKSFNVLCISWQDTPLYRFGVSANKIFDYMYAAKPLIMSGTIGENIVEIAKCGITTSPLNSTEIKEAILYLKGKSKKELNEIGLRGKDYILKHNTMECLSENYIKIFNELGIN